MNFPTGRPWDGSLAIFNGPLPDNRDRLIASGGGGMTQTGGNGNGLVQNSMGGNQNYANQALRIGQIMAQLGQGGVRSGNQVLDRTNGSSDAVYAGSSTSSPTYAPGMNDNYQTNMLKDTLGRMKLLKEVLKLNGPDTTPTGGASPSVRMPKTSSSRSGRKQSPQNQDDSSRNSNGSSSSSSPSDSQGTASGGSGDYLDGILDDLFSDPGSGY
ncbi:MAG: hypothetical protein HQK57_13885 [Deltaproteobacteria bacterium]|nr:hypothetical protein [Deltaproteobacteria bacterium]